MLAHRADGDSICSLIGYVYVRLQEIQIHRGAYASNSNSVLAVDIQVVSSLLYTYISSESGAYCHSVHTVCFYINGALLLELHDSML